MFGASVREMCINATITAKEPGAQPNRKMKVTTTTPSGLKYKKAFNFLVCNCTHECGPHSCMSALMVIAPAQEHQHVG